MVGLAAGSALGVAVVYPRRRGSRRGFIYWESIVKHGSGETYADKIASLSETDLAREQLHHCFELASVCQRKYRTLTWALRAGTVGAFSALFYLLLF